MHVFEEVWPVEKGPLKKFGLPQRTNEGFPKMGPVLHLKQPWWFCRHKTMTPNTVGFLLVRPEEPKPRQFMSLAQGFPTCRVTCNWNVEA